MALTSIEKYYNKFNEDKRLKTRHGQVEFLTTTKYILKYISKNKNAKILDIGAGTGAYSKFLKENGFDVTAVELVAKNLSVLKQNVPNIPAYLGNALNLKRFKDNSFDFVLLLGPMYHLFTEQNKLKALNEAKRVVKTNGLIFVAYCLNEYAVISYAFKENNYSQVLLNNKLTKDFKVISNQDDLYSYDNLKIISNLKKQANLKRVKIFSPDGPTDYMRQTINKMDEQTFLGYINFVQKNCERKDLLGAGSHIVDILKKE